MLVPAIKLPEKVISKQITDFLEIRKWRPIRNQVAGAVMGRFSTGEPGMPDYLFLFYMPKIAPGASISLWVEMKRPEELNARCRCLARMAAGKRGKCTVCNQANWKRRELERGALFGPGYSIDVFAGWYERQFAWLHQAGGPPDQMRLSWGGAA